MDGSYVGLGLGMKYEPRTSLMETMIVVLQTAPPSGALVREGLTVLVYMNPKVNNRGGPITNPKMVTDMS